MQNAGKPVATNNVGPQSECPIFRVTILDGEKATVYVGLRKGENELLKCCPRC
jgi:hypothetical protein